MHFEKIDLPEFDCPFTDHVSWLLEDQEFLKISTSGPIFIKELSQGLGLIVEYKSIKLKPKC